MCVCVCVFLSPYHSGPFLCFNLIFIHLIIYFLTRQTSAALNTKKSETQPHVPHILYLSHITLYFICFPQKTHCLADSMFSPFFIFLIRFLLALSFSYFSLNSSPALYFVSLHLFLSCSLTLLSSSRPSFILLFFWQDK